jgi:hypothetical protein
VELIGISRSGGELKTGQGSVPADLHGRHIPGFDSTRNVARE